MICHYIGVYDENKPLAKYPDEPGIDQIFLTIYQRTRLVEPISFIRNESYTSCILHEANGLNVVIEVQNMDKQDTLIRNALKSVRDNFMRIHSADWKNPPLEGFTSFIPQLQSEFKRLQNERLQKLNIISDNLASAAEQSKKNLEDAYTLGASIDQMQSISSDVSKDAELYNRTAAETRRKLFWNKWGLWITIGISALIILFLIIIFACGGFKFPKC